jgi:dienelactone hydrolase
VPIDEFLAGQRQWRARIDEQRIGLVRPAAPVLVYHGARDPWPDTSAARRLGASWRARGADVTVTAQPVAEHGGALVEAVPAVRDWLAARLAARPAARSAGPVPGRPDLP